MKERKSALLEALRLEIIQDTSLPLSSATLVFGEGNSDAEVLFIGEAPGAEEDRLGRPFVGRSGQLLRNHIRSLGWNEDTVYITNIVKRRPPNNRDPLPEEIEAYRPFLKQQIRIIDPDVIVTLGRFAMNYFLPEAKITRDQGKIFRLKGKCIYPVFHPAAALRGNAMLKSFGEAMKNLPEVVRRCSIDTAV